MSNVKVKIDNQTIEIDKNSTILDAINKSNSKVPTLCHHPSIEPSGACRICVVEDKKSNQILASCTTPVRDGMEIDTKSKKVKESRKLNLELLLADHPNDCMICESDGNCDLQDLVYDYDIQNPTFGTLQREVKKAEPKNSFIEFESDKCILCGRCVRVCKEIQASNAIDFSERGSKSEIFTMYGKDVETLSSCVHCGQCVDICPTGALGFINSKNKGRAKDIDKKVQTTCAYCGVGCQLDLKVKNNEIIGVDGVFEKGNPNPDGETCVKGRFGYEFINHPDRLKKPLIKKNNEFEEVSWDEAFDYVADKFETIVAKNGKDSIGGLTSARCTNEDNYLFQKMMRGAIGNNNVDHCARL